MQNHGAKFEIKLKEREISLNFELWFLALRF